MSVNLGTAIGYLDLDTSKFTSGFSGALKSLKGFTGESQNLSSRMKMVGNSISSVGSVFTKTLTPAILGAGAVVTKTGASFESAMSQVAATMGKSKDEIKDLEAAAIEMGSKTSFSATQAAEGLNYLALAGYTSEQQIAALPKVLNLAAAGGMELADASDMLTDAMSALGLASSDSEALMNNMNDMVDKMAMTASKSNTSVAQLGEGILTVGGTAKQLAGGTTELSTVLGLLADNGIKASEGGTHLRNILLAMQPTTKGAINAFEELGLKTYDAEGKLRPLEDIFKDLKTAMANMTDEEKQAMETAIFNKTDLSAVNALLSTSSERWEELAGAIDKSGGAADKMAETQLDNLKGDLTLLGSAIEGLQIRFYNLANGSLRGVVQWVSKLVEKINSLSDEQLDMIAKIALVVAAIGPVLVIGGKLISTVGSIIGVITKIPMILSSIGTAFSALSTMLLANPIGIALTLIVAAVAALAIAWKKDFGGIQEKTKAFIDFIKELPSKIKTHFDNTVKKVKDFKDNFVKNAKESGEKFINGIETFIKELPYNLGVLLGKAIAKALLFREEFPEKAKEAAKMFLEFIVEHLKDLGAKVKSKLDEGIKNAKQFVKDFPSNAKKAASEFVKKLKEKLSDVKTAAGKIKDKALDAIKNLPEKFKEAAKDTIEGFKKGIKDKLESAKKVISDFANGIVDGFKSALDIHSPSKKMKKEVGEQIANGVIEGIEAKKNKGKIKAKEYAEALLSAAETKLKNYKVYHDMTLQEEVDYWNKIRSALKKGTQQRIDADNNYFTAKKELNEKLKSLDEQYANDEKAIYESLKDNIDDVINKYNDAVESRKNALLSSFNLFEAYSNEESVSSQELIQNLYSQTKALSNYTNNLNKLTERGILPEELVEEIRKLGVDATAQINALNQMTDEQLNAYASIWKMNMELATKQAVKELEPMKEETSKQIEKLKKESSKKLDELKTVYNKQLESLGVSSKKKAKKVGESIVDSLSSGMNNAKKNLDDNLSSIKKSILKSLESMYDQTLSKVNKIVSTAEKAKTAVDNATSTKSKVSVSGSHKAGLDYVPYDGYIARLHKGEAVLTEEQNKNRGSQQSNTFIFNGTPPLDERETARQFKLAQQQLALKFT